MHQILNVPKLGRRGSRFTRLGALLGQTRLFTIRFNASQRVLDTDNLAILVFKRRNNVWTNRLQSFNLGEWQSTLKRCEPFGLDLTLLLAMSIMYSP